MLFPLSTLSVKINLYYNIIFMSNTVVCHIDDISVEEKRLFSLGDESVLVYHLQDGWYATEAHCTHSGALLSEGEIIDKHIIECPMHGARFDIKTGKVLALPATHHLKTYQVKVTGEEVSVIVGDCESDTEEEKGCGCTNCACGKISNLK